MAFRDQSEVLRERLEAAEKRIAQLERRNAELAAKHSPTVRGLAVALGVVLVLGTGVAWHLGMQNRGLAHTVRQGEARAQLMRTELDEAIVGRENAENAVIAGDASCSERTERALAAAHERTLSEMRSGPRAAPTSGSPSRYFWVSESRGREDVGVGEPCLVTIVEQDVGACALEVICGGETPRTLVPRRVLGCDERADGWMDADDHDGTLRIALRGPQLGVRDEADSWSLLLANERPCR